MATNGEKASGPGGVLGNLPSHRPQRASSLRKSSTSRKSSAASISTKSAIAVKKPAKKRKQVRPKSAHPKPSPAPVAAAERDLLTTVTGLAGSAAKLGIRAGVETVNGAARLLGRR